MLGECPGSVRAPGGQGDTVDREDGGRVDLVVGREAAFGRVGSAEPMGCQGLDASSIPQTPQQCPPPCDLIPSISPSFLVFPLLFISVMWMLTVNPGSVPCPGPATRTHSQCGPQDKVLLLSGLNVAFCTTGDLGWRTSWGSERQTSRLLPLGALGNVTPSGLSQSKLFT